MILTYSVTPNCSYKTIREIINNEFKISSRLLALLKRNKRIKLNNISTYIDKNVSMGNLISIDLDFEEDNSNIIPCNNKLDIIYEDDAYIIINKPAGIPVHPSANNYSNTLSNSLKFYYDSINLKRKIRPVNRLDKNTSGLVIFAKNQYIQENLIQQMLHRSI